MRKNTPKNPHELARSVVAAEYAAWIESDRDNNPGLGAPMHDEEKDCFVLTVAFGLPETYSICFYDNPYRGNLLGDGHGGEFLRAEFTVSGQEPVALFDEEARMAEEMWEESVRVWARREVH